MCIVFFKQSDFEIKITSCFVFPPASHCVPWLTSTWADWPESSRRPSSSSPSPPPASPTTQTTTCPPSLSTSRGTWRPSTLARSSLVAWTLKPMVGVNKGISQCFHDWILVPLYDELPRQHTCIWLTGTAHSSSVDCQVNLGQWTQPHFCSSVDPATKKSPLIIYFQCFKCLKKVEF